MLNIFFISNDNRVVKLAEYFQPFFKTKIRKASDFDQGLKEVFENRPSVVFIQSDIGSVSGETVARHIKSLLGSDSPRIVFMGEDGAGSRTGNSWCDDWILLRDSEPEFQKEFAEFVSARYPDEWKEIASDLARLSRVPGGVNADGDDLPPARCEQSAGAGYSEERPKERPESGKKKRIGAFGTDNAKQGNKSVPNEEFQCFLDKDSAAFPVNDSLRGTVRHARRTIPWLVLLLLLALSAAGVFYLRARDHREPVGNKADMAVKPAVVVTGSPGKIISLPSFIKPEWRDLPYSESHPGWERYVSPEYQIRLFRENAAIKALQVIATERKFIPEDFPVSLVKELGHAAPLPAGVNERKDGFTIKRVLIEGFGELALYREEGSGRIKALVLELT